MLVWPVLHISNVNGVQTNVPCGTPLTAPQVTTGGLCRWKAINKEGRHVGLDFYDLLIEGDSAQNACAHGRMLMPWTLRSLVHLSRIFRRALALGFCSYQPHRWLDNTSESIPLRKAFRGPTVDRTKWSNALDRWVRQLPYCRLQPRGPLSCDNAAVSLQTSAAPDSME